MRLRFFHILALASCTAAAAAVACGGISDPTKEPGSSSEKTATITGKLTGTTAIPAGAHVALFWSVRDPATGTNGVLLGADAPVVGTSFTMTLNAPPDSVLRDVDKEGSSSTDPYTGSDQGGVAPGTGGSAGTPEPAPAPAPAPTAKLRPMDNVSGTVVTESLMAALGGFVIYVDANGNGQLDIDANSAKSSPDTILGGSSELMIAYLKGGGTLAYEKLRDKSGVLPTPGFNLVWENKERFLPMSALELKLDPNIKWPSGMCGYSVVDAPRSGGAAPAEVKCSADGRSYTYEYPPCVPPPPEPAGLCSSGVQSTCAGAPASPANELPPGPVPSWWPCPVDAEDAGTPNTKPPVDGGI